MTLSAHRGGDFLNIQAGKITYLHNNPKFAKITVTGTQNQVYVSQKLVNKHSLRVGNSVEFKSKAYDKGPSVTEFTKVRGESVSQLNTHKPSQKRKNNSNKKNKNINNSKSNKKGILGRTISKIKKRYEGPQGFLRRLFLVAMGGNKSDYSALESRAESLEPFIEYVEHSQEAYKHLRKTARFVWKPVENERYIMITKQLGTKIRVRSEVLPYILKNGPVDAIFEGARLIHPKGNDSEILVVRSNSMGIEFLTSRKLSTPGWMIFGGDHSMSEIEWDHNTDSRPIESITVSGKNINILNQTMKGEWIELVLDAERSKLQNQELLVDKRDMEWEFIADGNMVGPLNDGSTGRQAVNLAKIGQSATVRYTPTGEFLYDSDGIRYSFKVITKPSDHQKLRIELHPDVLANIDEDNDTNPLDILFSPDSEYNDLIVNFSWKTPMNKQKVLKIISKDINSKTITIRKPYFKIEKDAILSLQPNLFYIERQLEMLTTLRDYPLPHHDALLKLTEQGTDAQRDKLWEPFDLIDNPEWEVLTRETDGTGEQRDFVRKALSTPDFAILQGPPGSGKTTAIIELIVQLAKQNKKILLCGSTQASIDNVLLRIKDSDKLARLICPLRIGRKEGIYDSGVHALTLSEQIENYADLGLSEEEAEDLILRQTNLTCGTMAGIIGHPWIRGSKFDQGKKLKTPQAHFDVLIVDEASKTTFQQFIIPAAFARRWVLVGDVRQLPPFQEASEVMTNLEMMKDSEGENFPHASQRACLILRNLGLYGNRKIAGRPIMMIEGDGVPSAIVNELNSRKSSFENYVITIIGSRKCNLNRESSKYFSPREIIESPEANIHLHSSDIIIIGSDCYSETAHHMPAKAILRNGSAPVEEVSENRANLFNEPPSFSDKYHPMNKDSLLTEWSYQMCWRLNRIYELKVSKNSQQKEKYENEILQLLPKSQDVSKRVEEVRSIALPSVLECLQSGFAQGKSQQLLPETTLTQGFPEEALSSRFSRINFQHRMHPDISAFSRKEFYENKALNDANTLEFRAQNYPFEFRGKQSRKTWINVKPPRNEGGYNISEISAIRAELEVFIDYSRKVSPEDSSRDNPHQWEVAVLSPYQAQRRKLVEMVQELTGLESHARFNLTEMKDPAPISLLVSTTDRFQGQEADIVFISLRNASRVGFLDSPNRMNVAITRAREWRVIVGNHTYFAKDSGMKDPMLRSLAIHHSSNLQKPRGN
jgi:DNA polymerase III delta prime subunit